MAMERRDFKGIWIPREVWLSEDLTLQEKVFLVEIDSLDGPDGCYANNEYFSKFFGISKVRVSEVINSLIRKGYLTSQIKIEEGNKRTLKTLINFSLRPSQTLVEDPHKGKFKHNNTDNNTKNNTDNSRGKSKISNVFIPPTEQEVKAYFTERTGVNGVASQKFAEKFIGHYTINDWKYGKNKTQIKDWKAAARTSWDMDEYVTKYGKGQKGEATPTKSQMVY